MGNENGIPPPTLDILRVVMAEDWGVTWNENYVCLGDCSYHFNSCIFYFNEDKDGFSHMRWLNRGEFYDTSPEEVAAYFKDFIFRQVFCVAPENDTIHNIATAIRWYFQNLITNRGHLGFDSLGPFSYVFIPLSTVMHKSMRQILEAADNENLYRLLYETCETLYQYGSEHWPGRVHRWYITPPDGKGE